jgi:hypothetical protein
MEVVAVGVITNPSRQHPDDDASFFNTTQFNYSILRGLDTVPMLNRKYIF